MHLMLLLILTGTPEDILWQADLVPPQNSPSKFGYFLKDRGLFFTDGKETKRIPLDLGDLNLNIDQVSFYRSGHQLIVYDRRKAPNISVVEKANVIHKTPVSISAALPFIKYVEGHFITSSTPSDHSIDLYLLSPNGDIIKKTNIPFDTTQFLYTKAKVSAVLEQNQVVLWVPKANQLITIDSQTRVLDRTIIANLPDDIAQFNGQAFQDLDNYIANRPAISNFIDYCEENRGAFLRVLPTSLVKHKNNFILIYQIDILTGINAAEIEKRGEIWPGRVDLHSTQSTTMFLKVSNGQVTDLIHMDDPQQIGTSILEIAPGYFRDQMLMAYWDMKTRRPRFGSKPWPSF